MNALDLILKKRNDQELSHDELAYLIDGFVSDKIPSNQIAAFLMAVYFRGMNLREIADLTEVFIKSGVQLQFPADMHTVDKHSTGGVGDKISPILAPIVAACGLYVPMISGRGLGHTGGTLDKLESIPGFRTSFSNDDFIQLVKENCFAIISQSDSLVPADRIIYDLRNLTGTVENFALITASIMSKKIAEGAKNLVIDLKVGRGAFMPDIDMAKELAKKLIRTGEHFGQKVSVVFTNMNSPLGKYVGNALEIKEVIQALKGDMTEDIEEIVMTLGEQMLLMGGKAEKASQARAELSRKIANGEALEKFRQFIAAQHGDSNVCDDPSLLPAAKHEFPFYARQDGWISAFDLKKIGYLLSESGAGRIRESDVINYGVGARFDVNIGDHLNKGDRLGILYTDDNDNGNSVASGLSDFIEMQNTEIKNEKLIIEVWGG